MCFRAISEGNLPVGSKKKDEVCSCYDSKRRGVFWFREHGTPTLAKVTKVLALEEKSGNKIQWDFYR